jgi:alpha-D-ribose 1-methylphosphonate 5-triphosphate diphosphatase
MWLTDLRVVLPDRVLERGSIRIDGTKITEIIEGHPSRSSLGIAAHGLTAIPGVIDIHGDMLEREIEPRPGTFFPAEVAVQQLDKRLAANGITTAFAAVALGDRPDENDHHVRNASRMVEQIETLQNMRSSLLCDILVHARVEVTHQSAVQVIAELLERSLVNLLSLMDHSPGQGQFRDMARYVRYYSKYYGGDPVQIAAEAEARIARGEGVWSAAEGVAHLARVSGVPLASHDDDTAEKVAQMIGMGASISEFPVTLEAAIAARERGLHVAMGAPNVLRGGSHSGNLAALDGIRAGAVDVLATDYHPASPVLAAFKLANTHELELFEAVKLISENAAKSVGLHDRGRLEPGMRADITLVEDLNVPRVRATFREGRAIYRDSSRLDAILPALLEPTSLEAVGVA